ncbi:hypothetical protein [Chryseosolibacter indicus]|uniref:DUF4168 domain-containing protein n=1 Tax=Chryseosolibacter indicus TaxID=2782351 RepID=A0ABS5VZB6_9BACT|nr:hypothetical protein [Chryseosolibacter indicus]MBT1706259.1 hypothetical protein [Chryseosolibacter indicus]
MKTVKLIPMLLFSAVVGYAQTSQSGQSAQAIKDEDLRKYAVTMDSIKVLQETLQQIVAENVQKNTVMSVARYNELFKIEKDPAKLQAANATQEEIAFLQEIGELKTYNLGRINTVYKDLVKDYVGIKTFNTIKKSLETDQQLKTRYDNISQDVASSKQAPATGNSEG